MRLLEQQLIQLRGFRNVVESGKIIGFQIPIRLTYYRGVWASMLRPATVKLNGETYTDKQIYWTIDGKKLEQEDLKNDLNTHWNSLDVAILTIRKEGGIEPGLYQVEVVYDFSSSYLPPAIDTGMFNTKGERKMVLVQ
ncbi:MAG: hypothetical protein RLZZ540_2986 [Bacteroidota bacterium]|jgi:hypothetical protein